MVLIPTTRASLLLRLRDPGDHEAWVEFVALYEPVAYRLLRRHGLQDADAREVLQELLLAVNRSIDRWNSDKERSSFRAWLRRVTRNLVVNWLRQRGRRQQAVGGSDLQAMLEQLPEASAESFEFDRELQRAQFRRASEQVRAEVNENTWQAFWETAVLGRSAAEAATILGMQVGAVRVAKCRVVLRLRATLAQSKQPE